MLLLIKKNAKASYLKMINSMNYLLQIDNRWDYSKTIFLILYIETFVYLEC